MRIHTRHANPCTIVSPMVLLIAILPAASTLADTMVVRGKTLSKIQIAGYSEGMIEYRTARGEFDQLSILNVESIQVDSIDGVSNFNAAETFMQEERPRKAVERYEKALKSANGFWRRLTRARLVQASDESFRFEKTVGHWLKIAHRDEVTAALLLPRNLPDKRSPATRRVLKKLERSIERSATQKERALLQMLRFETLFRLRDAAARVLAAPLMDLTLKAELLAPRTTAVFVNAGDLLIEHGESAQVQRIVEKAIVEAPEGSLPFLLLLKSKALLAVAVTPEECLSAALPAMRVVIHFPNHTLAGDGLVLAAKAHDASGRPADAKRLLEACIALDKTKTETKAEANRLLKRLTKASKQTLHKSS